MTDMQMAGPLVVESRDALDGWLLAHRYRDSTAGRAAHCSCGEWDINTAMTHQEHLIDVAFSSGVVTTAEAHREQIACALEQCASDASYAYPEEVTDTYLDAALVVRRGRSGSVGIT